MPSEKGNNPGSNSPSNSQVKFQAFASANNLNSNSDRLLASCKQINNLTEKTLNTKLEHSIEESSAKMQDILERNNTLPVILATEIILS